MGEPRYRALLIGNAVFRRDPQGLPKLHGPRADVDTLADALADPHSGMFAAEDIETHIDRNLQSLREELHRFIVEEATRDDVLLLYYSGHGKLDLLGRLHLCASDTRVNALPVTALRYKEDIDAMIEASPASATVTILDCCHSGAFRGGDLKVKATGSGRCVITSARASELALDALGPSGMSPFTTALVTGLRFGTAAGNLTAQDLYDYLETELSPAGNSNPQFYFDGEGTIAIARRPAPSAPGDHPGQFSVVSENGSTGPANMPETDPPSASTASDPASEGAAEPESSRPLDWSLPEPRTHLWHLLNEAASATMPASDDDVGSILLLCKLIHDAVHIDAKWSIAVMRRIAPGSIRHAVIDSLVTGLAELGPGPGRALVEELPSNSADSVIACLALTAANAKRNPVTAVTALAEAIRAAQSMPRGRLEAHALLRLLRFLMATRSEPDAETANALDSVAAAAVKGKPNIVRTLLHEVDRCIGEEPSQASKHSLQASLAIRLAPIAPATALDYFRYHDYFLPDDAFKEITSAEIADAAVAMLEVDLQTAFRLLETAERRCRTERDWTDLFHALLAAMKSPIKDSPAPVEYLVEFLERVVDQVPDEQMHRLSLAAGSLAVRGLPIVEDLLRLDPDERRGCRALIAAARAAFAFNPTAAKSMAASAEHLIASGVGKSEQSQLLVKLTAVLAVIDFAHSLRLFSSIPDIWTRAGAADAMAEALALSAPDRIDEFIRFLGNEPDANFLIVNAAKGIARTLPRRAVALAADLSDATARGTVLASAVAAMIPDDLEEAEAIARSITEPPYDRAVALGLVATAIAVGEPERAAANAAAMPEEPDLCSHKVVAFVAAAKSAAADLPQQAAAYLVKAEQVARKMNDDISARCRALVMIAEAYADKSPMRAAQLLTEAKELASDIPESDTRSILQYLDDLMVGCAGFAPRFAEQLAIEIGDAGSKHDEALRYAVKAMAATDPRRADKLVKLIDHPGYRLFAQADLVKPLSAVSPAKAERVALEMELGTERARALFIVAEALHRRRSVG